MARLDIFERELQVATVGRLTGEEHRKLFVEIAEDGRDKEITRQRSRRGVTPAVETTVDGIRGAQPKAVKLGGRIRFDFLYWAEIAEFALQTLRDFSPVESGAYRNAHFVMAGGAQVDPSAIPAETAELIVTNDEPYARKIQIGAMKMSVPPRIYDRARSAINAKYGKLFKIDVTFVNLVGAYVLKKKRGTLRYPALSIKPRVMI